jgi:DNA-binding CsgD family transcriptional regulator/GAF domain-containing protein
MAKSNRAGQARTLLQAHMGAADLRDLEVVLADAEQFLGQGALPAIDEITDFDTASAALEQVWHSIQTSMSDDTTRTERTKESTLDELADRMVRSERVVRVAGGRARDAALTTVRESLAMLGDIDSVDSLITAGAEAVCRLGFDRSVVSRVESNTWLTEQVHLEDSEWAAEILAAARANPVHLTSGLPEDEARRRRKPILVTRVQEREAVHQALKDASKARSYVCAPIMVGPRLMGFVHGDRYFHRGDVTDFDAEVIGLFAQGFGFALERAVLAEQLQQLRATVGQVGAGLQAFAAEGTYPVNVLDSPSLAVGWHPPPVLQINGATGADADLTRREIDVFRLMAQGETNQRIARRLSISEGTVKSHVKHILRKLSAANRAEAVARWHEARSPQS